jgi:hypothetical protein
LNRLQLNANVRTESWLDIHAQMMEQQHLLQDPIEEHGQTMGSKIISKDPVPHYRHTNLAFLIDLPNELLYKVIDYVTPTRDLKTVCLVDLQLYKIFAPRLYRYMRLDLHFPRNGGTSPVFPGARIGGLPHVRFLKLDLGSEEQDKFCGSIKEEVLSDILNILQAVPENALQSFKWIGPPNLRPEFVYQRQRCMVELTICDNDLETLDSSREILTEDLFPKITQLTVYKASTTTQSSIQSVLEKLAARLEHLDIEFEFDGDMAFFGTNEVRPPNIGPLSRSLFSTGAMRSEIGLYPKLQSLRLSCVCLRTHLADWRQFFKSCRLKHLHISFCRGAMDLLHGLTITSTKLIGLQSFVVQHEDHGLTVATQVLEPFLLSLDSLEKLMINLRLCHLMPSPASIIHHGKSLKVLSIHCSGSPGELCPDSMELDWGMSQLEQICVGCPHLKELSCAWPFRNE